MLAIVLATTGPKSRKTGGYAVNVSTFMQKVTSKAVAPELVPEDLRLEVGKGVVVGGYVAS